MLSALSFVKIHKGAALRLSIVLASLLASVYQADAQNIPPSLSVKTAPESVEPGATTEATLVLKFAPGLHGYQNPPSKDYMIPVVVKSVEGATIESVEYPAGTVEMVAGELAAVYSGETEIRVTLKAPEQVGDSKVTFKVSFQQCDERACYAPSSVDASATLSVVASGTKSSPPATGEGSGAPQVNPSTTKEVNDPANESGESKTGPPQGPDPAESSVQSLPPAEANGGDAQPAGDSNESGLLGLLNTALVRENWAAIIPLAVVVGLALCLTPCVFPMIPVTVSFFSSQTAEKRGARFAMGVAYALGIAVTYGTVGGVAAASEGAVGELFTKRWFAFALAALLIALALSMFDVYEIRLPNFLQKQLKGRSGVVGALTMGLLMGFAAAPCAGAFVAAVAVKVAQIGSVPLGIGMFGLMGLGMGLPFIVLASLSAGAKVLPKSGGWLKTVKAVLGLVVVAIAFQYLLQALAFRAGEARTAAAWAGFQALCAIYLLLERSDTTRAISIIKGSAIAVFAYLVGTSLSSYNQIKFAEEFNAKAGPAAQGSQVSASGINWTPFNDQSIAEAAASGKVIMIDGRADWCVQCREIEHGVFNTPDGLAALSNVALLSIDWSTGVDQKYIDETKKRFNIVGLPHIVFMSPGGKEEFAINQLHSVEELRQHLRKAGAKL